MRSCQESGKNLLTILRTAKSVLGMGKNLERIWLLGIRFGPVNKIRIWREAWQTKKIIDSTPVCLVARRQVPLVHFNTSNEWLGVLFGPGS